MSTESDLKWQVLCGDSLHVLRDLPDNSIDAIVTDPPYGIAFMAKKWDYDVPSTELWVECLRVLKPGGHLLAFAGTRTQHRMAVRIEDAGFEIRDMIAWIYGSGFPKSLDVSKAIDRAAGAEREVVGEKKSGLSGGSGSTVGRFTDSRNERGMVDVTAPATDNAKRWEGWGTCLKPALEPVTVARKPLDGTVAENVVKHGTGAMNIDACRIETDDGYEKAWDRPVKWAGPMGNLHGIDKVEKDISEYRPTGGRWPANLIHDGSEEVVALFPEVGASKSGGQGGWQDQYVGGSYTPIDRTGYDEPAGSAARFFYTAKVGRAERQVGCEDIPKPEQTVRDEGGAQHTRDVEMANNHHPTVKPVDLMRYLIRLVTPKGGVVLDPFLGSGSTGIAALLEDCLFVGIEREPAYAEIASARIKAAENREIYSSRDGTTKVQKPRDKRQLSILEMLK